MAKPLQGILIVIVSLRLLKTSAADVSKCVTNEEIPPPSDVEYFSTNAVPTMTWNFTSEEEFSEARFFVEFRDTFYDDWNDEQHCDNSSEKFCETVSAISTGKTCPVSDYTVEYEARVRAYLPGSKPVQCSEWANARETLYLPYEDQLSPPNFEIVSQVDDGQILVKNEPIFVKHTNMSLNCYHDGQLNYEIEYWVAKNMSQTLQTKRSGFSMRSMAFNLVEEPLKDSEICVRMRTVHRSLIRSSEWKTKCIVLKPGGTKLNVVALSTIVTVGAIILFLVIILIAVKVNQVHKYVYRTKYEVPTELVGLVNQTSTLVGDNSLRLTAKDESDHTICDVMLTNTAANVSSTESKGKESNTSEVVYLLSPEALKSTDFPRARDTPKPLVTGSDEEWHENQSSDNESIPYVCSLHESEVRTERSEANRSCSSNQRTISPHRFTLHSVQDNAFIDLVQSDSPLCQAFDESWHPCQKAMGRFKTIHSQLSASANELAETPEYAKIYIRHGSSLPDLLHAKQAYCSLTRMAHTQETYMENKIKLNDHHMKLGAKVENILYHDEESSKPVHDDLRRVMLKKDATVCLNNPTYNPKPRHSDFTDNGIRGTKTKSSSATLHEDLEGLAGKITPMPPTHVHHPGKRYSLYQRRLPKDSPRRDFGLVIENLKSHLAEEDSPDRRIADTYTLKMRRFKRTQSVSSGSNTFSPARDRTVSADSGYQMGRHSVSDECCSLSPPMTPDDPMLLDVFSNEGSPINNDVGNELRRFQLRLKTFNVSQTQRQIQDCADYLKTQETSEITPYVSVESRIGSYVKDGIDQSAYVEAPGK